MGIRELMKDKTIINEAVNLKRKLTSGGTVEDLIKELFSSYGDAEWTVKDATHIFDKYGMNARNVSDLIRKLKIDGVFDSKSVGKANITSQAIDDLKLDKSKSNTTPTTISKQEDDKKGSIDTKSTNVKDLSKGKLTKLMIPQSKSGDKLEKFLETVTLHMMGNAKGRLLLTGDPGTGKSKTVETVMSLLRLQVITIEAPHTSEESVISIPYLIRRGSDEEVGVDQYKGGKDEMSYEVVNAESALITKLKRTLPIKDNEYKRFLNNNKLLQPLANEYAEVIEEINKSYKTVLFLDEFYRCFGGEQMISVDILDPKFKEFVESRI